MSTRQRVLFRGFIWNPIQSFVPIVFVGNAQFFRRLIFQGRRSTSDPEVLQSIFHAIPYRLWTRMDHVEKIINSSSLQKSRISSIPEQQFFYRLSNQLLHSLQSQSLRWRYHLLSCRQWWNKSSNPLFRSQVSSFLLLPVLPMQLNSQLGLRLSLLVLPIKLQGLDLSQCLLLLVIQIKSQSVHPVDLTPILLNGWVFSSNLHHPILIHIIAKLPLHNLPMQWRAWPFLRGWVCQCSMLEHQRLPMLWGWLLLRCWLRLPLRWVSWSWLLNDRFFFRTISLGIHFLTLWQVLVTSIVMRETFV